MQVSDVMRGDAPSVIVIEVCRAKNTTLNRAFVVHRWLSRAATIEKTIEKTITIAKTIEKSNKHVRAY